MTALSTNPPPARPQRRNLLRSLMRNRSALVGLAIVLIFVVVALLAGVIAPYAPDATNWGAVRQPPSADYWLGTDELGRDILSRLIHGARASLQAGVASVLIALVIGVPFGLMAGFFRGWVDAVISRCAEALLSIPFLITAIALAAFLGPSLRNAMLAIGIAAAPLFARLMRAQTISVMAEDYIENARSVGVGRLRMMLRHVVPNAINPIIVQSTITVATAIIAEASLSFLGLGQQPPDPSWGSMLNTAKAYLEQAPWMAIWPGLAIFLVVLGLNFLGDGLRDALDPKDK